MRFTGNGLVAASFACKDSHCKQYALKICKGYTQQLSVKLEMWIFHINLSGAVCPVFCLNLQTLCELSCPDALHCQPILPHCTLSYRYIPYTTYHGPSTGYPMPSPPWLPLLSLQLSATFPHLCNRHSVLSRLLTISAISIASVIQ